MDKEKLVVFEHDLEQAISAVYDGEMNYDDFKDDMGPKEFENLQQCNRTFAAIALKCHPELSGKEHRHTFAEAKDALASGRLDVLNAILARL